MSTGIGFAGLGKYLNDKSLSLLRRGKGASKTASYREDLREHQSNKTNYEQLSSWQAEKRLETRRTKIIILLVLLGVLIVSTLLVVT